jgi:hypothetical protein
MVILSTETTNSDIENQENTEIIPEKPVKKSRRKKLNKNRDNNFPREDRNEGITRQSSNPREFADAWTSCSRCKSRMLSFGKESHYIDGFPFCHDCFEEKKSDYIRTE